MYNLKVEINIIKIERIIIILNDLTGGGGQVINNRMDAQAKQSVSLEWSNKLITQFSEL